MFRISWVRTVGAAVAVGLLVYLGSVGIALGQDPREDLCPIEGNKIAASFEMPSARDYSRYIPRMLRSPELETDSPAFVVVFDGPTRLNVGGSVAGSDGDRQAAPANSGEYSGVVCVVVDNDATVYTDVDITAWQRP